MLQHFRHLPLTWGLAVGGLLLGSLVADDWNALAAGAGIGAIIGFVFDEVRNRVHP